MSILTHVTGDGRPLMVDVGGKPVTARSAVAESRVHLPPAAAAALRAAGFATAKGPVFHTAIIAGTMAAKRTHELIPFCHPKASLLNWGELVATLTSPSPQPPRIWYQRARWGLAIFSQID